MRCLRCDLVEVRAGAKLCEQCQAERHARSAQLDRVFAQLEQLELVPKAARLDEPS